MLHHPFRPAEDPRFLVRGRLPVDDGAWIVDPGKHLPQVRREQPPAVVAFHREPRAVLGNRLIDDLRLRHVHVRRREHDVRQIPVVAHILSVQRSEAVRSLVRCVGVPLADGLRQLLALLPQREGVHILKGVQKAFFLHRLLLVLRLEDEVRHVCPHVDDGCRREHVFTGALLVTQGREDIDLVVPGLRFRDLPPDDVAVRPARPNEQLRAPHAVMLLFAGEECGLIPQPVLVQLRLVQRVVDVLELVVDDRQT